MIIAVIENTTVNNDERSSVWTFAMGCTEGGSMIIYLVIFITLVAAFIAALAQLVFKKEMLEPIRGMRGFIKLLKRPKVIMGFGGYLLSLVVYLYALGKAPLSLVYPLFASTFIFIFIISALFLREKPDLKRAVGIALVFLGIVIIAVSA